MSILSEIVRKADETCRELDNLRAFAQAVRDKVLPLLAEHVPPVAANADMEAVLLAGINGMRRELLALRTSRATQPDGKIVDVAR